MENQVSLKKIKFKNLSMDVLFMNVLIGMDPKGLYRNSFANKGLNLFGAVSSTKGYFSNI